MKKYAIVSVATCAMFLLSCSNGQTQVPKTTLAPTAFAEKINTVPSAPILDVRTPEEFSKGHIQNAKNFNWNSDAFDNQIAGLDKSKPVFVYCLSGGRSKAAAGKMRSDGFKEVYELDGGMMKWRSANLPETTSNASPGMTKSQFEKILDSDKLVLVDFYADWCAPCKKMKPYLDDISKNMSEKVSVVRINADDNQELCKELRIEALPVLQVYKNKIITWTKNGFVEKEEVLSHLK